MERHLMMAAINKAAMNGKKFECETLTHQDRNDDGKWIDNKSEFNGRIDAYPHVTMVHFKGVDGNNDYEVPLYLLSNDSIRKLYDQTEVYAEVRCDYMNEADGWWCVDAWKTADDDEEGEVVAWVDGQSGNIYYKHETAMSSEKVRNAAEEKQKEVRKEMEQRKGELGETIAMLTAQVWHKVYDKMREPDCTVLSCAIRDAAYKFEEEWYAKSFDERDGYYIDMIDQFAERLVSALTDLYC